MKKNELTEREKEILNLASMGNSYKEISRNIGLSLPTIKFYMGTAREKLGATNGLHAVAIFIRSCFMTVE